MEGRLKLIVDQNHHSWLDQKYDIWARYWWEHSQKPAWFSCLSVQSISGSFTNILKAMYKALFHTREQISTPNEGLWDTSKMVNSPASLLLTVGLPKGKNLTITVSLKNHFVRWIRVNNLHLLIHKNVGVRKMKNEGNPTKVQGKLRLRRERSFNKP